MSKHPYKRRPPGSLKAATTALLVRLGGPQAAVEAVDALPIGASQLARCMDPDAPDSLRVDVAVALERAAGEPVVTRWMAGRHGALLLMPPAPGEGGVAIGMADLGEQVARLYSRYALALADGRLSPMEAREMRARGDECARALASLLAAIDAYVPAEVVA